MMKKRLLASLLAMTMALTALPVCASAEQAGADTTLRVSAIIAPEMFSPVIYGNSDKAVMHAMYDCLLRFDNDGNVIPMLAESYEQDGLDVTFHLREAYFSSGNRVTADDVVFSFNKIMEDPTMSFNMSTWASGCEAVDESTVVYHLANNYCKWENFAAEFTYVVEAASYDDENAYTDQAPVGSGAYTFVSRDASGLVTLAANENYWAGAPEYKTVEVYGPMDDSTALIALQTGELDLKTQVGRTAYSQALDQEGLTAVSFDSWSSNFFLVPIGDAAFRQAIFHGINRQTILDICNDGNGTPCEDMFSLKVMGDYAGAAPFTGYDLEMAQAALAETSVDLSQTFTIEVFDNDSAAIAQCIQGDLMMLGINTQVAQEDSNTWFENLMSGNMQMGISVFGTDMVGVEDMLSMLDPNSGYSFNISEELIAAAQEAPAITDDEERKAAVIDVLNQMAVECPWVPLYDTPMYMVYADRVGNVLDSSAATCVYYFGDMTIEA